MKSLNTHLYLDLQPRLDRDPMETFCKKLREHSASSFSSVVRKSVENMEIESIRSIIIVYIILHDQCVYIYIYKSIMHTHTFLTNQISYMLRNYMCKYVAWM